MTGSIRLTGFPNRRIATEMLDQAIAGARQVNGFVSVLIVDINRFKHVNDLFGSETGDAILKQVSERLRSAVRGKGHGGADRERRVCGRSFR